MLRDEWKKLWMGYRAWKHINLRAHALLATQGFKMEERESEIEYCLNASKCPGGLIMQIAIISKDRFKL